MACTSPLKLLRLGQLTTGWGRLFHSLIVSGKKDLVLAYGTGNFMTPRKLMTIMMDIINAYCDKLRHLAVT